jgi:hypothetical protein
MRTQFTLNKIDTGDGCIGPNIEPVIAYARELALGWDKGIGRQTGGSKYTVRADGEHKNYNSTKQLTKALSSVHIGAVCQVFRNMDKGATITFNQDDFENARAVPINSTASIDMPVPRKGYVINCAGQELHEDARIFIQEADRPQFGGARIIDALTFIKKYPQKRINQGMIVGVFFYVGIANEVRPEDKQVKWNVPDVYAINGWKVGGPK